MAGLFEVKGLQARKRALIAESEVYRQSLTLQVHNLRIRRLRAEQKITRFTSSPLFLLLPLVRPLFRMSRQRIAPRKRPFGWMRLAASALFGWQFYRRLAPLLRSFTSAHRNGPPHRTEEHVPAANI